MTQLVRDRRTWLTYSQLGVYGYFLYGFGPALTVLRDDEGFSRTIAGLHGTALAVGALLSALCVAPLATRFGRTAMIWAGLVLTCTGIVVLTSFTAVPLTLFGALLCSFGGSFVVTCTSTVLSALHNETGPAAITEANAVAASVGAGAPLVVGLSVAAGLGWRPALLLVLPVVGILAVFGRHCRGSAAARSRAGRRTPWSAVAALLDRLDRRHRGHRGGVLPGAVVRRHARRPHRPLQAGAAASVTALVAGMAIGRIVGGRLALRLPVDRLLYGAIVVNAVGFALFWTSTSAVPAVAGLLVCGLGVSLYFPLGLSRAIAVSDGRPDQATARVGLGAAFASGVGPFVLGALADAAGIHAAMLVVPVLLVIAAVGIRIAPALRHGPDRQPA